jgi:hypothetical protein
LSHLPQGSCVATPRSAHGRTRRRFIKIDQIRNLQKELSFRPFEAEKKACIIEAAERMNLSSANAFLKTLEEPPGNALLILLTSNIGAILPTILSRCQRLSFSPIPEAAIENYLCGSGTTQETARIAASLPRTKRHLKSLRRNLPMQHLLKESATPPGDYEFFSRWRKNWAATRTRHLKYSMY